MTPTNEDFERIPGIYNYCDSWCERCSFTKRCQNFALRYPNGLNEQGMNTEKLVTRLMGTLAMSKLYVNGVRQEQEISETELIDHEVLAIDLLASRVERYPAMMALCDEYLTITAVWLKQESYLLEQADYQQTHEVHLGIRSRQEALDILDTLKEAWEVIRWYRTLIPVKMVSILHMIAHPRLEIPTTDSPPTIDSNGKAKLILVSVDRSLSALHMLLDHYPEKTDTLLNILVVLDRMRQQMEEDFPLARDFQRPGLDELLIS